MNFTSSSHIVQSYVLLINKNLKKIEDVPNLFNLIEVVKSALEEK